MLKLYYGDCNYSSWSLRAWLLLKHLDLPFVEQKVEVSGDGQAPNHRAYAPNNLVPVLHHDDLVVWDTLAIAEYLHEQLPNLRTDAHLGPQVWPSERQARARARCLSAEMHSGFGALRSAMPMNIKLRLHGKPHDAAVQANLDRLIEAWTEARTQFGQNGPYLFGEFCAADAMFAPVVWRLHSYNVALPPVCAQWCETMRNHPAMRAWEQAALAEQRSLAYDRLAESYGGSRV